MKRSKVRFWPSVFFFSLVIFLQAFEELFEMTDTWTNEQINKLIDIGVEIHKYLL